MDAVAIDEPIVPAPADEPPVHYNPITQGGTTPLPHDPPPVIQAPVGGYGMGGAPTSTIEPQRPRTGRKIVVTAAIVAGLASLGVVGGILLRSGGGGGADTPDAAVKRFVKAVTDRDITGAFQATAPDELRGAGDLYKASVNKARDIGLMKQGDPLGGLQLSVANLKLNVATITDDLAKVTVGDGTLTWNVDPAGFPVGDTYKESFQGSFEDAEPSEMKGSVDFPEDTGDAPILYTVRRSGRWYVSLYSTITHYMGFDPATAAKNDASRRTTAASTPEAALTNLLQGAAKLDVDAVLNSLAPAEARIARIYETYIREAFEGARSTNATVKISSPSFDTDAIDANRAKVSINTLTVDVNSPEDGTFRVSLDGSCATMSANGDEQRFCMSDAGIDQFLHLLPSRSFVVAVKDDNGWYISTVETMFEVLRHTISAVTKADIDAFTSFMTGEMEGFAESSPA